LLVVAFETAKMFHSACDAAGENWETEVEAREYSEDVKLKTYELLEAGTIIVEFMARRL
jgi:hypothetical protein